MNTVLDLTVTDGRWLRSLRTRAAIIDSWQALIDEGDLAPTAKGVADRAGIGLRTVFQHFSDMTALQYAAGDELTSRLTAEIGVVPADAPTAERVVMLVTARAGLHEQVTALRRSCERQEWLSDEVRSLIDRWEQARTESNQKCFAAEIAAADAAEQNLFVAALDAAMSWATWNQLRARQNLDVADAITTVQRMVGAILRCAVDATA